MVKYRHGSNMEDLVGIYNEEGGVEDDLYQVIRRSTGTKNIIKIKNSRTGEERLIHKDRTFLSEDNLPEKRRETLEKDKKTPKKKAKKKKPLVKFELKELDLGILFKSKSKKAMEAGEQKINIESFCMVSEDATKWKHFNLYNHSLGKKGKPPEFGENDNVKVELSGNLDAVEKYLTKKGYVKV